MAVENLITEHIDIWTSAVKTKSTSGRGSSKKLELYGVKKLRELILDLAVRGKLVPQDPNDEPASVLLERIASEKAQLIKDKKIKKPKKLLALNDEDIPFGLPEGWEWSQVNELAKVVTDGVHHTPKYLDNGVPFISVKDIDGKSISFDDCKYISQEQHEEINQRCNPEKGDILLCRIGTLGRATIVDTEKAFSLFVSVGLLKFFNEQLLPEYLHTVFHSPLLLRQYDEIKAGGSHTNKLNLGDIPRLKIPVAPLQEQHRIVAKVDELMALCDQLEQQTEASIEAHQVLVTTLLDTLTNSADADELMQNWARISEHFDTLFTTEESIDQLKQTILQLAVMGKLVPQDPNDEPAAELLKRIAEEKTQLVKEKKIKKQKALPPISEDEKPFELPNGWEWCHLNSLISEMDAGWSPACPPEASPNHETWGVLKTTAVQSMEYREYENKVLSPSKEPRPQYEVKNGDILITRAGPKNRVGVSCLVQTTRPKLMISDKIIRFHLIELGMSNNFVSLCLNAGATSEYLESAKSGMAESQMNISQDKLKMAPIPLPPIREQTLIVKKVEELIDLCDKLKLSLEKGKHAHFQFTDSVIEQAV
ncbi:type I restriction endonuclease subunit S [Vibrio parahaemolyticus]|uniref:restriction endonuclease subunit S n=1 Tax=Vibrio parahaemolyticus TaxID=670 RepID=UPI00112050E8|nr:restriction endonuclease subunit S [Vibrio parahaemolyticus]TOB91691.1 type I restriction endonuclease subunit S [Vibrio parahaemolyticus]